VRLIGTGWPEAYRKRDGMSLLVISARTVVVAVDVVMIYVTSVVALSEMQTGSFVGIAIGCLYFVVLAFIAWRSHRASQRVVSWRLAKAVCVTHLVLSPAVLAALLV
jgi:hypothetical protein